MPCWRSRVPDLDKLNAIITKAQWVRKSTGVTPREFMLADLVEALAHQVIELNREARRDWAERTWTAMPRHPYRPDAGATA